MGDDLCGARLLGSSLEAGWGEEDAGAVFEALGEVGQQLCQQLTLAALRAKQVGEDDPCWGGLRHRAELCGWRLATGTESRISG